MLPSIVAERTPDCEPDTSWTGGGQVYPLPWALPTDQWVLGPPCWLPTARLGAVLWPPWPLRLLRCISCTRAHCPRHSPPGSWPDSCRPEWKAQEGLGTPGHRGSPANSCPVLLGPCHEGPNPVTPGGLVSLGLGLVRLPAPGRGGSHRHSGLPVLRADQLGSWEVGSVVPTSPDCVGTGIPGRPCTFVPFRGPAAAPGLCPRGLPFDLVQPLR